MTVTPLRATIAPLAEQLPENSPGLAEVADTFLGSLAPQVREKSQGEVYKFVRWFGLNRRASEITPHDVASYGELLTPSATRPVKTFLSYAHRKGFSTVKLATHLRPKKSGSKGAAFAMGGMDPAILTADGRAKLETELADLRSQLPDIIDQMQRAAADKDFRENAPLNAARERKSHLEGRIKELETTLELAKVMDKNQHSSRIRIGYTVVLADLSSGRELSYLLVDPQEAKPSEGRLSIASPLGKALLDQEKGQTVEVVAPAGTFCYRVDDIVNPGGRN